MAKNIRLKFMPKPFSMNVLLSPYFHTMMLAMAKALWKNDVRRRPQLYQKSKMVRTEQHSSGTVEGDTTKIDLFAVHIAMQKSIKRIKF